MTITSTASEISYAGNGVTTVFAIPFVFDTSADLKVVETVAGVPGVVTTGFSISGGGGSTGSLTRSVALPVGTTILILDNPELTQPVDYTANDPFPAETHEHALDRVTRIAKRLFERVERSLRVADGDLIDGDNNILPIASVRAGKFAAYDGSGKPTVASGTGNDSALRTDLANGLSGPGSTLVAIKRTAAEIAAGVTPTAYNYESNDGITVNVKRFGDNAAGLQTAVNVVNQAGGGKVVATAGKTYTFTSAFTILSGVKVDMQGSTIQLTLNGDLFGVDFQDDTGLENFIVNLTGTGLSATSGDFHTPIVIGRSFNNTSERHNITVRNGTISGDRSDGNGVIISGSCYNVTLENLRFPSSSALGRGILVHWSGDGSAPPAATEHPFNIKISNIWAGALTNTSTDQALIFLSAGTNCSVENFSADRCARALIQVVGGDYGGEYSGSYKPLVSRNISVKNGRCLLSNKYTVYVDTWEDNYAGAPIVSGPFLIENVTGIGDGTSNVLSGVRCLKAKDVIIRNCDMSGHLRGFELEEATARCRVYNSRAYSNREHGFYAYHGTAPVDCAFVDCEAWLNNTAAGTAAGFYVGIATRTHLVRCISGNDGTETTQTYAFRIDTGGTDAYVEECYARSGGTGFSVTSGTDYTAVASFRDNRAASGVTTGYTGRNILPIADDLGPDNARRGRYRCARGSLTASTTPTAGTWVAGDIIFYTDPIASDYVGTTCVTGGSPGTWKRFGATTA